MRSASILYSLGLAQTPDPYLLSFADKTSRKIGDELRAAIGRGTFPRGKQLVQGGASIAVVGFLPSALTFAAICGHILTIEWLLTEGGATISEVDCSSGWTALLGAAIGRERPLQTVQWLIEHGGANIADKSKDGETVWDLLTDHLIVESNSRVHHYPALVTDLLRFMVLKGIPPGELTARLSLEHRLIAEEGPRLLAGFPAYLIQRQALLGAYCPLITLLLDLVHGYEAPATTEELWATGVGATQQR
jgi:hypothetical protein